MKHYGNLLATKEEGSVHDVTYCDVCQYSHIVPLPKKESINLYYATDTFYTDHSMDDWFEHEASQQSYWKWVYDDWLNYLKVVHTCGDGRTAWAHSGHELSIFDVGAGAGWFLKYANDKGWVTQGSELSLRAKGLCEEKGLSVDSRSLSEHRDGFFDVVSMILLLEHLVDPAEMLGEARRMLQDDGLLLVCVPNDFTWLQEVAQKKWGLPKWWVCEPHINYFSVYSTKQLIRKAGFEVTDIWTTYPMEMFLLQGRNYVNNEALGRICYEEKMEFERTMYSRGYGADLREIQEQQANHYYGREVVVIARKV